MENSLLILPMWHVFFRSCFWMPSWSCLEVQLQNRSFWWGEWWSRSPPNPASYHRYLGCFEVEVGWAVWASYLFLISRFFWDLSEISLTRSEKGILPEKYTELKFLRKESYLSWIELVTFSAHQSDETNGWVNRILSDTGRYSSQSPDGWVNEVHWFAYLLDHASNTAKRLLAKTVWSLLQVACWTLAMCWISTYNCVATLWSEVSHWGLDGWKQFSSIQAKSTYACFFFGVNLNDTEDLRCIMSTRDWLGTSGAVSGVVPLAKWCLLD